MSFKKISAGKRQGCRTPKVLLLALLCLLCSGVTAFAAEAAAVVKLPVSLTLSGSVPATQETYSFVLEAVDDAPLPEETTVTITGEGETEFPAISYSEPGVYCYTVSETAGTAERAHYDSTVYYVKVTVLNAQDGGLEAVAVAYTDAAMSGEKTDIRFENTYDAKDKTDEEKPDKGKTDDVKPGKDTTEDQKPAKDTTEKTRTDRVKTGDSSNAVYYAVLGAAAVGIAAVTLKRRRKA